MNDIERAIETLKDMKGVFDTRGHKQYSLAALDLAISALEKQLNNGWIPTSERLPQLPDGKSFIPLNATILAPSGLRNTVQMTWELKRGKPTWCYLGGTSDWNVIAWQPLPEPYKEENYDGRRTKK